MASRRDRMTEMLGTSPEPCMNCDLNIWADLEIGVLVDSRWLKGSTSAMFCPGTLDPHEI